MRIQVKNKNLTKSLFQKSNFSRSNSKEIPVFWKIMEYLWNFSKKFKKRLDKCKKRVYIKDMVSQARWWPNKSGRLAQSVEQGTENPRVPSSILGPATIFVSTPVQPTGFFVFSPKVYPQKPPHAVSGKLSATPNPWKTAQLLRFFENYLCQLRF